MKKSVILLLILLILFIFPLISAAKIEMKSSFEEGETLIAKVSGNFLKSIIKDDVFLYRNNVRVPILPDVEKINDDFYIYFSLLNRIPGNYSLILKNLKYMKGVEVSEEDLIYNFIIINKTADFSVNPGVIKTEGDFYIEVQNLQEYEIQVNVSDEGYLIYQDSLTLKSGEKKKINFQLSNLKKTTLTKINLFSSNLTYEISAYLMTEGVIEEEKELAYFRFEPSVLNISLPMNSNTTRVLYLHNTGTEILKNISLSISESLLPYLTITNKTIQELDKTSSIKIEFYLFSQENKSIEGEITADTSNLSTFSVIYLNFQTDYNITIEEKNDTTYITKTCEEELGGKICNETIEECDQTPVYAKDGVCCLGKCKKIKKASTGKIVGWIILIVIILVIIWFFKTKYKKTKRPFDLLKIARGRK